MDREQQLIALRNLCEELYVQRCILLAMAMDRSPHWFELFLPNLNNPALTETVRERFQAFDAVCRVGTAAEAAAEAGKLLAVPDPTPKDVQ